MRIFLIIFVVLSALIAPDTFAQPAPTLDSLVVNPVIPSHNYVTHGEYHNFKAYAHSNSGGSLTYQWYVNGTPKTTSWELHYSFPTWNSSPYTIHVDICDGSSCVSWEEIYTAGSPPGGGGGGGIGPVLDSLVVNSVIPSHNYVTQGEYHNFKAYAHSTSGGSLTYQWYVNGTPKTTAWELHYSFPTWDSSPYNIRLEIFDGPDSTSWEETYTPGTPPGGGNVADKLYYIRDHLGSIRVVIDDNGDVVHYADYYPFGMEMAGRTGTTERPKEGFTGHEKDEETGEYYAGARYYDAEIGRWNGIDRLAEKYPALSPFSYVGDDPLNYLDANGDSIWVDTTGTGARSLLYVGGRLVHRDGTRYMGKNAFALAVLEGLKSLVDGGINGTNLVNGLMNSIENVIVAEGTNIYSGKTVYWNPLDKTGGLSVTGSFGRPAFIGLGHELAHARDDFRNGLDTGIWHILRSGARILNAEKYASYVENLIRAENGIDLRVSYSYYAGSTKPHEPTRLLDRSGRPLYFVGALHKLKRIP